MAIKIYNSGNLIVFEDTDTNIITNYPSDRVFYRSQGDSEKTYNFIVLDDHSRDYNNLGISDILKEDGTSYSSETELGDGMESIVGSSTSSSSAKIMFSQEVASLGDGEEIDSGFLDFRTFSKQQITISSDTAGVTFVQTLKISDTGSTEVVSSPLALTSQSFNVVARKGLQRIQVQNNTGSPITNVILEIKAYQGGDGTSVVPLSATLVPQSQAALTRSVIAGQSVGSTSIADSFRNVSVNQANALLTSDFGTEVARGLISNYNINLKFGRNSDIDTGTTPEDVWNGGGLYTGFNATTAETLEVFSSDVDDQGSLVSSGTATGGSSTTLIDSGATFVTDGVAAGDLLINDTDQIHGIISSVDSETQVTVYRMTDGAVEDQSNASGDTYRIVNANDTGAAVIKLSTLLDADYNSNSEYVILNGTTGVNTTGTYIRCPRQKVVLAGSTQSNEGEITIRQSTTTANVMSVMSVNSGQSSIACDTVPVRETWIIKSIHIQMTRANGSAGSAQCRFQIRERGGSWQTRRYPEISDSQEYLLEEIGGIVLQEFTDIRWNVQSVSDNNTIVSAEFEYFRIS